jgi:hypothetical protein
LGRFGPSVGLRHPPQNGPLTCFDQWSNWHRVDHTRPKTCTNPQKRAAVKNEGFEATFSIMGAGTAPICLQGRLFNGRGLHTECSWCRIGWFGLQSCFGCSARSPPAGLPHLGRFGPSVGLRHPPQNSPLTCFDQWSNWHRVDHTRPKACTNPQKRAAVKNEGFEATFSIMGAGTAPICLQGRLFNGRGLHTECSWCRIGWFGLQSCFGCSARSPPQVCHIWGDLDPPLGCAIPPQTAL